MYMMDYDFVTIRKQRNKEAETSFRAAIKHYIEGSWSEAQFFLGECNLQVGGEDGPCKALIEFMQKTKDEKPEDWAGYRNVDYKEPPINVDFMSDDEEGEPEGDENGGEEDSDD